MDQSQKRVWVVGEALMDLIPVAGGERQPMVGGGPANTAKAVSRLGYSTFFVGGVSSDAYGRAIETELLECGVDLSLAARMDLPTALAIATIDEHGLASYEFELEGSASFAFNRSWLPAGEPDVLHVGSVATLLEPGAREIFEWVSRKSVPLIFDPNVRPSIENDKRIYRASVERWIDVATIVKLSEDDFTWLYGGVDEDRIADWQSREVSAVIVTRAERGISAYGANQIIEIPAVKVELVDSVGAGDTIGAILVEGVLEHGITGLINDKLKEVLIRATKAAAITCSRAGANPPLREELEKP